MTSKSAKDSKTRELLQKHVHRTIDNNHEIYPQLIALLQEQPQWTEERISRIYMFRITRSRLNKALILQAKYNTKRGKWFRVSWSLKSPKDPLQSAFRHAIKHQIWTWRRYNHVGACCAQCGTDTKLHVDHKEPQFIELTRDFMTKPINLENKPSNFAYHRAGNKFLPKDKNFKIRWQNYHQKYAELQWLCQTCNLTKKKAIL